MKYARLCLVLILALGAMLAFACGGDDNNDDNGTEPTATAVGGQGSEATATESSSSGGDDNTQLNDLISKAKVKEAKVAYDFTTTAGGTTTTGSFTLYSKPPTSWRFDYDAEGSTGTIISANGKTILCTSEAGSGTCFESPVGSQIPLPFVSYVQNPDQIVSLIGGASGDVNHSTKTIAGQDADCYSGAASGGTGEVCFSNDGVLLSIHGTDTSGIEFDLEATSVEGSVAEADLTPPYPVESFQ